MSEHQVLRLKDESLSALRREAAAVSAFTLASAATAVLVLASQVRPQTDLLTAGLVVAFSGAVAIWLDLRRKSALWRRYSVHLETGSLTVSSPGAPRRLTRESVQHVVQVQWPARGLVVRGRRGTPAVFIPEAIDRFEEVKSLLAGWRPVERSRIPTALVRAWPAVVVGASVLFASALGGRSPWVVVPSALLLVTAFAWSLANVLRSHRLGLRAKALSVMLVVPAGHLLLRAWQSLG